jgi:hypothetical protein
MDINVDGDASLDEFTIRSLIRMHAAFDELLRSLNYARELHTTEWDFAVELAFFHRLKLSENDLRWLLSIGFVSHAIELTTSADGVRTFRHSAGPAFSRKSCFVLTAKGVETTRMLWGHNPSAQRELSAKGTQPSEPGRITKRRLLPKWDCVHQELRIGAIVVKRFRVPAASQGAILAAFEEEAWPPRIDDPLPPQLNVPPKRRLQEAIRSLNRNQKQPLIRFYGDGNAQGVLWEFCDRSNFVDCEQDVADLAQQEMAL